MDSHTAFSMDDSTIQAFPLDSFCPLAYPTAMQSYFKDFPPVRYEGPQSDNPLAFRHYNPDELVEGKSMREHLRFSVVYWHTFLGTGADPFGAPTMLRLPG